MMLEQREAAEAARAYAGKVLGWVDYDIVDENGRTTSAAELIERYTFETKPRAVVPPWWSR